MAFEKDKGRILFIFIVGFVAFFISERVEAATCTYEFDVPYENLHGSIYSVEYTFDVDLSSKKLTYRSGKWSTGGSSKVEVKGSSFEPIIGVDFILDKNQCPPMVVYEQNNGNLKLFNNREQCKRPVSFITGSCEDRFTETSVTPKLELADGEKLPKTNCDRSVQNSYIGEKQKLDSAFDDTIYPQFNDRVEALSVTDLDSYAAARNEFSEVILKEFEKEIDNYMTARANLADSYACIEVSDLAAKSMESDEAKMRNYITKLEATLTSKGEKLEQDYIANGDQDSANQVSNTTQTIEEAAADSRNTASDIINSAINNVLADIDFGSDVDADCVAILGDLVDIIQEIFDIIKIAAPILLLFFGTLDFSKAVIANDNDAIKKATSSFIKRAIAAVAIFFLPFLINWIFTLPGIDIEGTLCGISKVVMK